MELKEAILKHWLEATKWLSYTVLWSLVPIWVGVILALLLSQELTFQPFYEHGEFVLYSAALTGPSLYLVAKDYKVSPFLYRQFFIFSSIFILTVCAIVFAAITLVGTIPVSPGVKVDPDFLKGLSVGLFLLSCVFSFLVFIIDCDRTLKDLRGIRKADLDQLDQQFDELGE